MFCSNIFRSRERCHGYTLSMDVRVRSQGFETASIPLQPLCHAYGRLVLPMAIPVTRCVGTAKMSCGGQVPHLCACAHPAKFLPQKCFFQ